MECVVCKKQLQEGVIWCENCYHYQSWDAECAKCKNLIHPEAEFCVYCNSDLPPERKGGFTAAMANLTIPIATLTSAAVLIASIFSLKDTIKETIKNPEPNITVLPQKVTTDDIEMLFYNSGDRVAYIVSPELRVSLYRDKSLTKLHRYLGPYRLTIAKKEESFIKKGSRTVIFTSELPSWEDTVLNKMDNKDRDDYLKNHLKCDITTQIVDTKNDTLLEPKVVTLQNEKCSDFLLYKYDAN